MEKQRIQWIDVAKAFGIFSIYLGHFADDAGNSYRFVFLYHIPLFFFLAGCTESFHYETNIWKNIRKKFLNLYVPFLMFAVISAVVFVIEDDCGLGTAKLLLKMIVLGCIRNHFIAGALWFLSCMFSMYVVFQIIKKLRYRALILSVCTVIFIYAKGAASNPRWPFNLDSALAYLIFYCLGYLLFEKIDGFLNAKSICSRLFVCIITIAALVYAVYFFFGIYLLEPLNRFPVVELFGPVIKPAPMIWLNIIAAYLFRASGTLAQIGRNTLYLCGSEYLIKSIVIEVFRTIGIEAKVSTPLGAYLSAAVLLVLANTFLVPIEKKIYARFFR